MIRIEGPRYLDTSDKNPCSSIAGQIQEVQGVNYQSARAHSVALGPGVKFGLDRGPFELRLFTNRSPIMEARAHFGSEIGTFRYDEQSQIRTISYLKRPLYPRSDVREVDLKERNGWVGFGNMWLVTILRELEQFQRAEGFRNMVRILAAGSIGWEAEQGEERRTPSDGDAFVLATGQDYLRIKTTLENEENGLLRQGLARGAEKAIEKVEAYIHKKTPTVCDLFLFNGVDPDEATVTRFKKVS